MTTEHKELLKLDRMPLNCDLLPCSVYLSKWSKLDLYIIDVDFNVFKLTKKGKLLLRNAGFEI